MEGLANDDPSSALFTHVPMWVQFRKIPFYLLTKKLAHDLGNCLGPVMKIDNDARGSINDKFIRARVQLPLYRALRSELILADEITAEEVAVQVRYERLPNFCLFCGFIGHMEARCDKPTTDRKVRYSLNLRVRPVYFEDPRCWILPDEMGQSSPKSLSSRPWRAPIPANQHHAVTVEQVVEEVARLSVDQEGKGENSQNDIPEEDENMAADTQTTDLNKTKKRKGWKRKAREEPGNQSISSNNNEGLNIAGTLGTESVQAREETHDVDVEMEPVTKKATAGAKLKDSEKDTDGTDWEVAATGPGATGKLSGATESARQEP